MQKYIFAQAIALSGAAEGTVLRTFYFAKMYFCTIKCSAHTNEDILQKQIIFLIKETKEF